jgi:two-component system, chemotaxis family, protein-glutamate methylesterase/glutaminase
MKCIKNILMISDDLGLRQQLYSLLESEGSSIHVSSARDVGMAWELFISEKPEVVMIDIDMQSFDTSILINKLESMSPIFVVGLTRDSELQESLCRTYENEKNRHYYQIPHNDEEVLMFRILVTHQLNQFDKSTKEIALDFMHQQKTRIVKKGDTVIAIGASTGGVEAIEKLLSELTDDVPPILIVQHMPENFIHKMSQRLNRISQLSVKVGEIGDVLRKGYVYIAPGGCHMMVQRNQDVYEIQLTKTQKVCHQMPAVDVLFHSVAKVIQDKSIGVILTGMGSDGALGLKAMHDAGAYTIAQDEATSQVFGMPHAAIMIGAVDESMPINEIGKIILKKVQKVHY